MSKKFNYYKYEEKKNIEHLRKLSPAKTLRICFDLINLSIELLKSSLTKKHKNLSKKALSSKIKEALAIS